MKVLLAVDGTPYGEAAVQMAGRLDLGGGDELKVISVVDIAVPLTIDLYGGYLPDTAEIEKAARENAARIVETARTQLETTFADGGPKISTEVLFGSPDSRIVETAEELEADLIVIGSHGHKRWERLLLGSVSSSVVNHAPCSVLIVRAEHRPAG